MLDALAALAVPIIFLISLVWTPNGIWKIGAKLKGNEAIREAMKAAQSDELEKISRLLIPEISKSESPGGDGSYQLQKIQKAIDYTIQRHDWYEAQRSAVLSNVLTLCGLGFTALGLYLGGQQGRILPEVKWIVISLGLVLVISLFRAAHLYNSELDQDRPYRLVSDIRHWYYRYSLSDPVKHYGERLDFFNLATDVLKERERYIDRALEVSSLKASLREDLEQLFILHVLVKHKSESLQKIRWTFFSSTMILSAASFWYFLYFGVIKP